jgi:hypothetical protein
MAKGGLVAELNPFYSYSVGLRNANKLDSDPAIKDGILPQLPNYSAPLPPTGISSLVPQAPGIPQPAKPIGQQSYATGGVVGLSPLQQRMAQAMRYYTGMGYSPAQAAGIVGNLTAESSLNPRAVGDKGTSFGMMQAHNERAAALRNFGGDNWQDFQTQLSFVPHELSRSESAAGRNLAKAQNVEQATQAMIGYERPVGWSANNPTAGHNYAGRLNYANQAYQLATGQAPVMASVPPISGDTEQIAGQAAQADQAMQAMQAGQAAQAAQTAQASQAADAAASSDPFGGLMGLLAMSQQQAPAPVAAPAPVRKAQPVDPDYATAITSQTPDAYADYLQKRRAMMGA